MKEIRVVYADNSVGNFYCEKVNYEVRAVSFVTTDTGEYIVIPYYNAYIIREKEVKDEE